MTRTSTLFAQVHAARQDAWLAVRSLLATPVFTAVAILSLALGLGATTAILSVVNGVLLRPLPYAEAGRLVVVLHGGTDPVSPANYEAWRAQAVAFSDMEAAEYWSPDLTGGEDPQQISALHVTPSLMKMLGVSPALGRLFTEADLRDITSPVVISHTLWLERFNGDPRVVGRRMDLNGATYTVAAVMPAGFKFAPFWATDAQLWAPMDLSSRANSGAQSLRIFARLRAGVSIGQAQSEMDGITRLLELEQPGTNRNVRVVALRDKVVGAIQKPLALLLVAVVFVLLIACANVAHMLLARGSSRDREIAVRSALGASRADLLWPRLMESGFLALGGGIAGVGLAAAAVHFLSLSRASFVPQISRVGVDGRVLLMALALSTATTLLCGLLPAIRSLRVSAVAALREASGGSSGGAAQQRVRDALVVSEFALALVLLVGAGLLLRSFVQLRTLDPGFDPRGVVTMRVATTGTSAADSSRHAAFYLEALQRVRGLPGVADAGLINHLPIAGDAWGLHFRVEGQPIPPEGDWPRGTYRVVTQHYFSTMGIKLLRGRDVLQTDRAGSPAVAVINAEMARRYWPGQNPLGRRFTLGDSTWITVVGVIANVVRQDWAAPPEPEFYLPFLQQPSYVAGTGASRYMTLVAKVSCDPRCDPATSATSATSATAIRSAIRAIEPAAPISEVQSMSAVVARATANERFYFTLLAVFAGVGATLSAIGIYGVISYAVARRRRELGIRIALGAGPSGVARLVLGHTLRLACIGAVLGAGLSLALTPLLRQLLYGVGSTDPAVFAAATLALAVVAAAAAAVPAMRAARVDPVSAMRDA